ncbi:hypothetical protein ES703_72853 [subsurface metagenome]
MKESLLTIEDVEPGIQKVTLDVDALCLEEKQREQFEKKFLKFLDSDRFHSRIFSRRNNAVIYLTENIIPKKEDERLPLLLLFGNPASHSVASGMFFSFEGNEREHRFWKILRQADILSFSDSVKGDSVEVLNKLRKKELYELSYTSPFRIGLAVFYTMPSPASDREWAGVSGLRKLFGKEALTRICECEGNRIAGIIREFVSPSGAVIAFQKDAYLAIKFSTSSDYTLDKAKAGSLIGNCQCDSDIRLFCLPPTRLRMGYLDLLQDFRDRILKARLSDGYGAPVQ